MILVADDSPTIHSLVRYCLMPLGLQIDRADDGQQAWAMLVSATPAKYRLLVTDYQMPLMDGMDLIRRIRLRPQFRALPIIMISTEPLPAGCHPDEYVQKPFKSNLFDAAKRLIGIGQ